MRGGWTRGSGGPSHIPKCQPAPTPAGPPPPGFPRLDTGRPWFSRKDEGRGQGSRGRQPARGRAPSLSLDLWEWTCSPLSPSPALGARPLAPLQGCSRPVQAKIWSGVGWGGGQGAALPGGSSAGLCGAPAQAVSPCARSPEPAVE